MGEKNGLKLTNVDDRRDWETLTGQCLEADLQQTWAYGQGVQSCIGWTPVRQVVTDGHRPLAMAQTLVKEVPVLGKVARMQHGPMFIRGDNGCSPSEAAEAIALFRQHWVEREGATLHLSPCLFSAAMPDGWEADIRLRPSDEALWESIRVDVTLPDKVLRKNMKRRWRNPLRKAEKAGLEIRVGDTAADLGFFLEHYRQATHEKGFSWPSPELVQAIWEADPSVLRMLFAVHRGERIGAMVLYRYAATQFSLVAWNSPEAGKFHAHNFLIWQSVCHARETGCKWLDLGGTDPEHLPGITKFKQGLGGEAYRLLGNFEARPSDAVTDGPDYRRGLGHILPGLALPDSPAPAGGTDETGDRVAEIIARFVREIHASDMDVNETTSLIDGGIIDSLSLVSVVQALQEAFGIDIGVQDITIDNFDRIDSIRNFVRSKLN